MFPSTNFKKLKESQPSDYIIRFLFGGIISAVAGLIGEKYGAPIGGLFLAFPAVLPASLTLLYKHEDRDHSLEEARDKSEADVLGAVLGSVGLICFALVVSLEATSGIVVCLLVSLGAWLVTSIVAWVLAKWVFGMRRRKETAG